jgi:hypothetical protein
MKIIRDVEQGTDEWFALRLGIPTASNFGQIITPTGKKSKSADRYMRQLIAEWLAGVPVDAEQSSFWMERGQELEEEARNRYEFDTGETVEEVGFIAAEGYGCSPDGLVGDNGMLEIKCPKASTLVEYYCIDGEPPKYRPQLQGQLWVAERQWVDFYAYHPKLHPIRRRIVRDDDYIAEMAKLVMEFNASMAEKCIALKDLRMEA